MLHEKLDKMSGLGVKIFDRWLCKNISWPEKITSSYMINELWNISNFTLKRAWWKAQAVDQTAVFSVHVDQTAVFNLVDVYGTAVFSGDIIHKKCCRHWPLQFSRSTSTRLQFSTGLCLPDCSFPPRRRSMLVDAVDVHFYCAFHPALWNLTFG